MNNKIKAADLKPGKNPCHEVGSVLEEHSVSLSTLNYDNCRDKTIRQNEAIDTGRGRRNNEEATVIDKEDTASNSLFRHVLQNI